MKQSDRVLRWNVLIFVPVLMETDYPIDIDRSLHETVADKIPDYRADYYNRPSHVISKRDENRFRKEMKIEQS